MTEFVTSVAGAKILGVSKQAIDQARKQQKITYRQRDNKNQYNLDELREYFSHRGRGGRRPALQNNTRPQQLAPLQPPPQIDQSHQAQHAAPLPPIQPQPQEQTKRTILVGNDQAISYDEASRVLKQEDAIRRQLANLEKEGTLIDREKIEAAIESALQELFPPLLSTMQGLVDEWGVRLCLCAAEQEAMRKEFSSAILGTLEIAQQRIAKVAKI